MYVFRDAKAPNDLVMRSRWWSEENIGTYQLFIILTIIYTLLNYNKRKGMVSLASIACTGTTPLVDQSDYRIPVDCIHYYIMHSLLRAQKQCTACAKTVDAVASFTSVCTVRIFVHHVRTA